MPASQNAPSSWLRVKAATSSQQRMSPMGTAFPGGTSGCAGCKGVAALLCPALDCPAAPLFVGASNSNCGTGGGCTCTDLSDSYQPSCENTARCCPHGHGAARLGCCAHIAVKVPLNDPAQLGEPSFCRHSVLQKQGSHRLDCGKSSMRPSEPKAVLPPLKGLEPLLDFHLLTESRQWSV